MAKQQKDDKSGATKVASEKKANRQAAQATPSPLASKSEAQLKREVHARMKHLGPLAKSEVVNEVVNKQVHGFVDFLREQSVVGLAIGLVLGTQLKQLADQLIASFINPLIGLLLPGQGSLAVRVFSVDIGAKSGVFAWGAFANTLISFIIVAAVVYYIFKGLKLDKLAKKKD